MFRKKLEKYIEVVHINISELFASPYNFIGRLLVHGLRICMLGVVYMYVYKSSGTTAINNFTALDAVWSLALVQLIYQSSRNTFQQLKDEIISGSIETKLNKPYSFIIFSFVDALGQAPIRLTSFIIVSVVLLTSFFGLPQFTALRLIGVGIFLVLGLVLNTLIQQIIALFGFWIENPDPIYWITSKLSWVVSGTFVPLALLPATFRHIADWFPLSAPFFVGRVFEINSADQLYFFIGTQLLWIVVLAISVKLMYQSGVKKISINGG